MELPLLGKINRPLPWIIALVTGGIVVIGYTTYQMTQTADPKLELTKLTVPAQKQILAVEIKASGTVEPIQSVNISPKAPGRLMALMVEQGAVVKAGQLLGVMDNRELQAQGFQSQARVKEAQEKLKEAEVNIPQEIEQARIRVIEANSKVSQTIAQLKQAQQRIPRQVDQARAQLKQAESRLKLAQERAKRNQYLVNEGAVSRDTFDGAANELYIAQANLLDLLQRLEQVKTTGFPEVDQLEESINQAKAAAAEAQSVYEQKQKSAQSQIFQLQAAVKAAQGQLQQIVVQFEDTKITAPFDGVITQRYANVGAFVTPSTSVSSSTDDSAPKTSILALARGLQIRAKVPEIDVTRLSHGQPVNVLADAYPEEEFKGQIIRIAPEAVKEQNVTSFDVIIGLITGGNKLRSKMNVDLTFLGKSIPEALVVPTVSIVTQEGQTGVMVLGEEGKPKFKPVKIGIVIDDKTQIISGIEPGDRVFIDLPESKNKKNKQDKKG